MIKYKVTFEITDTGAEYMTHVDEKYKEIQKQAIKSYIYEMDYKYLGIDLMKVTDFKIEDVGEE